ncbi:lysophospholipid acyltransferase family protein [Ideonella benzenivorans]|uniref:lysophospholipid acyltransferase family protein n=1 Tax=Ideonella benzenivorans TaxID=2831643 RepID=UPI0028737761|nr:lysophospholipid acyltransferase family protein [Ideonella benzenivorans]
MLRSLLGLPLTLWRLGRLALHLLHGMAMVALRFRTLDARGRQPYVQWWSAKLIRLIGARLELQGGPRAGATLFIANHVSWLDIASIHAACPQARFVSKADVQRWPLLGWLIRHVGTLFIERERKRDALRVVHQMAEALRQGDSVAVFPEGTTGAGPLLLPFHANLLQAAIAVEKPIQPIVLRYSEPGQAFGSTAPYIGDATLIGSIWRIVSARGLTVHVTFLPAVGSTHADRRALGEHLHAQIQAQLDQAVPA